MRAHNPVFAGVPDEELVAVAQEGDNEAFSELVERHTPACKRLAFSILRDTSDTEDEVQNAVWKAYEHLGQFNQDARFSTWLSRIVVNQCLMRLRKDRRARFVYLDEGVAGEEIQRIDLADNTPTPEESLAQLEISEVLKTEISRIPPLLRDVFILRDVEELDMPDVAGRLGISIAAAKSRLLRARLELRSRMERHVGGMGPAGATA
jgi:RNA polymerase sigma-70 factor, ECF subfamily